jgi:hypothetical protein
MTEPTFLVASALVVQMHAKTNSKKNHLLSAIPGSNGRSRVSSQSDRSQAGRETMALLEAVGRIEQMSIDHQSIAMPVHLRCPGCLVEFASPKIRSLDARVKCIACGVTSEFRELQEAWCLSRRPILAKAFPGLKWLTADYSHSDLCSDVEGRKLLA